MSCTVSGAATCCLLKQQQKTRQGCHSITNAAAEEAHKDMYVLHASSSDQTVHCTLPALQPNDFPLKFTPKFMP
jgi:hypothetical protein